MGQETAEVLENAVDGRQTAKVHWKVREDCDGEERKGFLLQTDF